MSDGCLPSRVCFQQQMLVRNWSYIMLSNIEGWIYCKRAIFNWVTAVNSINTGTITPGKIPMFG